MVNYSKLCPWPATQSAIWCSSIVPLRPLSALKWRWCLWDLGAENLALRRDLFLEPYIALRRLNIKIEGSQQVQTGWRRALCKYLKVCDIIQHDYLLLNQVGARLPYRIRTCNTFFGNGDRGEATEGRLVSANDRAGGRTPHRKRHPPVLSRCKNSNSERRHNAQSQASRQEE